MPKDQGTGLEVDVAKLPANVKMFKVEQNGDVKIKNFTNAKNAEGATGVNMIAKALDEGWSLQRPA